MTTRRRLLDGQRWPTEGASFLTIGLNNAPAVHVCLIASRDELLAACAALGQFEARNLALVLHSRWVPDALGDLAAAPSISLATEYLSLVWVPEAGGRSDLPPDALWCLCRASRGNLYRIAIDPQETLKSAIRDLPRDAACVVFWPAELGWMDAMTLVAEGSRLRPANTPSMPPDKPGARSFRSLLAASDPVVSSPDKRVRLQPLESRPPKGDQQGKSTNWGLCVE